MAFADLKFQIQKERVSVAVDVLIADGGRRSTREVSEAIAKALGADVGAIGVILSRMASAGDPRARASGETFKQYGKICRRYVWAAQTLEDAGPKARNRLDPDDVADFLAWKAARAALETPRERAERIAREIEETDEWTIKP